VNSRKQPELSILVCASGNWRSQLIQRLYSPWARVKRILLPKKTPPHDIASYDIVLWEWDLPQSPPDSVDETKLFLFSYQDEGNRRDMARVAGDWNIKPAGYLAMLAPLHEPDVGCLPLPPPNLELISGTQNPPELRLRSENSFFLCSPTYLRLDSAPSGLQYCIPQNGRYEYNQRLEWALRLADAGLLAQGQGLVESKHAYLRREIIQKKFGTSRKVFVDYVPQKEYMKRMMQSRLIFAPGGHCRWTYRHLEGMWLRGLVVSGDFGNFRTSPPLPMDAMEIVPDGAFDAGHIRDMLTRIGGFQEKADLGYRYAREILKPRSLLHLCTFTQETAHAMFRRFVSWVEDRRAFARHPIPVGSVTFSLL
jgi:hypothetical protein